MLKFLGRVALVVAVAAAAVALTLWVAWHRVVPQAQSRHWTAEWQSAPPVVTTIPGGLFEAASLRMTEDFYRADSRTWWGIYLGETVSQIQVSAVYRYGVPLTDPAWQIVTKGQVCVVIAPTLRPSLPVAIDTATLRERTESGWLRFDKQLNLEELRRGMSADLEQRARDPQRLSLVADSARRTIGEFVEQWLLPRGEWDGGAFSSIRVVFAEEVDDELLGQLR